MTKYGALLRGVNVGGKNKIKMTELKACFEESGFKNVSTYIQSGNVIFESAVEQTKQLEKKIESALLKTFKYNSKVLVRSYPQIKKVLSQAPHDWKSRSDLRCYIAFIKEPANAQQAIKEVETREGIDRVEIGNGVLYMTTLLSGLTKSKLGRVIGKKIYQNMTIRNYNTTQKIASLMEQS